MLRSAVINSVRSFSRGARRPFTGGSVPPRVGHNVILIEPVELGDGCVIGENVVLGPHVVLRENVDIGPNCIVGADVTVGYDTKVSANCTLSNSTIGNRCELHPGVQIGQDGFGWVPATDAEVGHTKKPQEKRVIIGDDVSLGANTTVDRGSWRDTVIGTGTKIDNLVQVAHNVTIGKHCLIAAQCGIAGSTNIGDYVMMGGQVGIAQHLNVGDQAQIAGKSGVVQDVPPGSKVGGYPAVPIQKFHRQHAVMKRLARSEQTDG